jgi:hypothetical protein
MLGRYGRFVAAVGGLAALLLLGAAAVPPSGAPDSKPEGSQAPAGAQRDSAQSLSAYERESLVAERAANRIAEGANTIARDQRLIALWQLVLGAAGVVFTGFAAFWAWRATHWAKEAAGQTKRSADADNAALDETRKGMTQAREDADRQATRFAEQLKVATATGAAAARQAEVAERASHKQLAAYVHAEELTFNWSKDGWPLFSLKLMNTGQTPAIGVKAGGKAAFGDVARLAALEHVEASVLLGRVGIIGATSPHVATLLVDDYKQIRREQITGDNMLAVLGRITYSDVFGKSYETEFGFFTTSPELKMSNLVGKFAMFRETE